jgi:hypothetical protein
MKPDVKVELKKSYNEAAKWLPGRLARRSL